MHAFFGLPKHQFQQASKVFGIVFDALDVMRQLNASKAIR